jgi:hypothetical protein
LSHDGPRNEFRSHAAQQLDSREFIMVAQVSEQPNFLIKKFGALLLFVAGLILTALGFGEHSNWLAALGILLLVAGAALLVLKIARRNRGSQP